MRRITGTVFQSLDGVVQAPGGPSEDPTGGFPHGGWLAPLFDDTAGEAIGRAFAEPFDLLLGRRTFDIFAAYWPFVEGDAAAMGEQFTRIGKYVLTRGDQPLPWDNSHRLADLDALRAVRDGDGPDLVIQGSSTLYPQLLAAGLLDRVTTLTFPVVVGTGKRLWGEGTPPRVLRMVDHRVGDGGVVVATYEPAGAVTSGWAGPRVDSPAEAARQARIAEGTW
jgi:dihydrofolate reductase